MEKDGMKWEYLVDRLDISDTDDLTVMLDNFGKQSWELVTVDNGIAYFKRPVQEETSVRIDYKKAYDD